MVDQQWKWIADYIYCRDDNSFSVEKIKLNWFNLKIFIGKKKGDSNNKELSNQTRGILYTSPKNTFQKLHFPEKHLAETPLSRICISLNVHFPEITFP